MNQPSMVAGLLGLLLWSSSNAQDLSLHVDFTGSSFDAKSHSLQGTATQNGKKITAQRLEINLNSMATGFTLRDKHMWAALEVSKYPQAILSNVVAEDGKFTGDLTIHGVTKKGVEGEFAVAGNKAQATLKTNISDYKIAPITYMNGSISVEDEVEIKATVPIVRVGTPVKR
jgi:polyisoprenoid-binding protein YceI